jgi:predicted DCC family thiol-disulfide oxidoreductase YuxK
MIFSVIPRPIRDWLYDRVASNRYKLFGKKTECDLPSTEQLNRFLK